MGYHAGWNGLKALLFIRAKAQESLCRNGAGYENKST